MRKIIAMLLALLMLVSCTAVFAEETTVAEGEWWNVLLLGGDARDMTKYERTDTIMILSVNEELGQAKLTSVMRDTWVSIPGHGKNKINAANFFGGPELAIQVINDNFGTDIQHYVVINMADMAEIVDLFGGVEVEVSGSEQKVANDYIADAEANFYNERLESYDYTRISETGLVHLNGVQAMAYCRDRYSDSDWGRVMRGQEVLLALAGKAQAMEINEVMEIAGTIHGFVNTNLTNDELQTLATTVLACETSEVGQYRIPADGSYEAGTFDGTWMIRPNLDKCAADLQNFIYGE